MLLVILIFTASAQEQINREVLPILTPEPQTYTEFDVRNTKSPVPFSVTALEDAPNVVIVLIDDLVHRNT